MKKFCCICLLILFPAWGWAAEKYGQTIVLDIGQGASDLMEKLCFHSSDIFDGQRCGLGASNHYRRGPKNLSLNFKNKIISSQMSSALTSADPICLAFIRSSVRTPEASGKFRIRVENVFTNSNGILAIEGCDLQKMN